MSWNDMKVVISLAFVNIRSPFCLHQTIASKVLWLQVLVSTLKKLNSVLYGAHLRLEKSCEWAFVFLGLVIGYNS